MPPNAKGGKGYKKKKKVTEETLAPAYLDRQDDQMVARAIRLLGDRNVLCYCNDNILRICHICGKMKGRVWIEPGDMVLISIRDFTVGQTNTKGSNRGDIIGKYSPDHYSKLKREEGVNQKLFMKLESMDGLTLDEIGVDKKNDKRLKEEDDCGFVFERDGKEDDSEEEGGERSTPRARGGRAMEATTSTMKDDDDINIDDI
jgi:translation initiation factor 1A